MQILPDGDRFVDPQFPRTPPYRGAPHSSHDGLVAEAFLLLDQLAVLSEHTVSRKGFGDVTIWCTDEVWPDE